MDDRYRGMTVNERLYVSGLMEDFDMLVSLKDVEGVIKILEKVEITDEPTIKSILERLNIQE
jgi:hypothetical protein